jgi:hypothetical protein
VIVKNWQGIPPEQEWVAEEIARLNTAVDQFAAAMKARLAEKAKEGWSGWDDPSNVSDIYTALLAHAAGVPLAARQEVDVANFAMMLWRFRQGGPGHGH